MKLVFLFLVLYHLNLVITQEPISKKVSFLTYNLIYHFIFEGCSKWIMYICFINAFEIHTKNDILTLFITLNHYRDDPIRLTNNKYQTYIYHVVNTLLFFPAMVVASANLMLVTRLLLPYVAYNAVSNTNTLVFRCEIVASSSTYFGRYIHG